MSLALSPLVAASSLRILAILPRSIGDAQPHIFGSENLPSLAQMTVPLWIFLTLGIMRVSNNFLNKCALNNWRIQPQEGWEWDNEIAVVTGGCNGIGRAIAMGLAQKGVKVAVIDVQEPPKEMTDVNLIKYFKCDITSNDAVHKVAEDIRDTLGHPSILVNNAGVGSGGPIIETTESFIHKLFKVNIISQWFTVKEFLPNMIRRDKGHVVIIASAASYTPLPYSAVYSSTKAAALSFSECLRAEIKHVYRAKGVMMTIVHPMWAKTDMTAKDAETFESINGPMMSAQDVADPVLEQIFSCRGGHVFVPESTSWMATAAGLPRWVQELLKDWTVTKAARSIRR